MIVSRSVVCGNTLIPYDLTISQRRKTVAIIVHPNKQVEVVAPQKMPKKRIQEIVQKKAPWIMKKVAWIDSIPKRVVKREYLNGETFLYLGRQYQLKIQKNEKKGDVRLSGRYLVVSVPTRISEEMTIPWIRSAVIEWYRSRAREKIAQILKPYSLKIRVQPPQFRLKLLEKRWGSCSQNNNLNFNLRIIMAPMSQVEYVVMHELCHIHCKNHSTQFWDGLRLVMPDYEIRLGNLKQEGWRYVL